MPRQICLERTRRGETEAHYNGVVDIGSVKQRLSERANTLRSLRVKKLCLFGSVARGQSDPGSELDLLVQFEGLATFDAYMSLKELLEQELNVPIDLVTQRALKAQLRDQILREAIQVA